MMVLADTDLDSLRQIVTTLNENGTNSINDVIIALGSIFLCVVVPIFLVLNYRRRRGDNPATQAAAAELHERARALEARIGYLERILDADAPGWRSRS